VTEAQNRWVERRFIDRLYERLGARYLLVLLAPELVVVLLVPPANALGFSLYVPVGAGKFVLVMLTAAAVAVGATVSGARARHRAFEAVRRWIAAGRDDDGAAEAWEAAMAVPRASMIGAVGPTVVLAGLASIAVTRELGLKAEAVVLVAFAAQFAGVLAAALNFIASDGLLGPVRRDIARHLDDGESSRANSLESMVWMLYHRSGRTYLPLVGAGLAALALEFPLFCTGLLLLYVHMSSQQFTVATLIVTGVPAISVPLGLWRARATAEPLRHWLQVRGEPVAAWESALRTPLRYVLTYLLSSLILAPAAAVAAGAGVLKLPASDTITLGGLALGAVIAVAITSYLIAEFCARPVLAEVARALPQDFEIQRPTKPLGMRLSIVIAAVAAAGAGLSMLFAGRDQPLHKLLPAVVMVVVLVIPVCVVLMRLVVDSVTSPLRDVVATSRRVGAGDLSAAVAVRNDDELGVLATSFNKMLDGLREREALRDSNVQLNEALRESLARIVAAADTERRKVERDLHDGAQQELVLIGLKLGLAQRKVDEDPAGAKGILTELRQDLDRAVGGLRDLAHGIYPQALETEGLPGALREALQRAAIPAELECDGARRYAPQIEAAVYFCCLEALQNAAKHAGEHARAGIRLTERDQWLEFEIFDDGRGFQPGVYEGSAGLQNMADRIGALGGELRIRSAPGTGTDIRGAVPLTR
jgi:signal transduction histidine kinase